MVTLKKPALYSRSAAESPAAPAPMITMGTSARLDAVSGGSGCAVTVAPPFKKKSTKEGKRKLVKVWLMLQGGLTVGGLIHGVGKKCPQKNEFDARSHHRSKQKWSLKSWPF
jgi:hypothetical protein